MTSRPKPSKWPISEGLNKGRDVASFESCFRERVRAMQSGGNGMTFQKRDFNPQLKLADSLGLTCNPCFISKMRETKSLFGN